MLYACCLSSHRCLGWHSWLLELDNLAWVQVSSWVSQVFLLTGDISISSFFLQHMSMPCLCSFLSLNRFPEVADLREVWWVEIRGVMSTLALYPNTQYAAYLVFKMVEPVGFQNRNSFRNRPVQLSVGISGGEASTLFGLTFFKKKVFFFLKKKKYFYKLL